MENHVTGYGEERSFKTGALPGDSSQLSAGTSPASLPPPPIPLPAVTIQSATLSANKVSPGTLLTVNAVAVNKGTVNGITRVKIYINGQEEASQAIVVESGKTLPLSFTVGRNEPGTYSVHVGGVNAGAFVVDELADSNIILFISSALVFFAFILGIIYIWRRRYG